MPPYFMSITMRISYPNIITLVAIFYWMISTIFIKFNIVVIFIKQKNYR